MLHLQLFCFFSPNTHTPLRTTGQATLQADKKDTSLNECGGAAIVRLKAQRPGTRSAVKWMSDELRWLRRPEATEAKIKGGRAAKTHSGWAAVRSAAVSLL